MKKIILYALVIISLASCSKRDYSITENEITRSGRIRGHHVEIISVPRIQPGIQNVASK